ncbi:hypothetical protein [Streptomyces rapamycinicus]|uniref:Lipoprotein n=2 Tax=Streptomyces rapamycinicus TaxID=1226757 RepID=A0A0A0NAE2_STRRN|nr:hypothetical protein [Streptomyces rapamycinicus]AGP53098.1 hypothetical protein M271_07385 [Streptomyces rapamycinicus NRRL 5491]MBB4780580.1 hypothetical protein [Streptomyces rapamycinicus]RLV74769.1 hypothetical protein D3C57_136125 [Streptomyces rapamycinicus NRRL 5491]UTO61294.1 hypothetical protein LJB45_02425 [Streptomyces rapamycinicus]UTP29241.1 hypothetical protein LIV37_07545 [Streptomyces rapamycinicus NRRL 5491]
MYDAADADAADAPHPVRTPRRHGPRAVAVVAAVGALLAIAGCGGGDGGGKADAKAETGGNATRPSASADPTPKAARVEQLASAAGCKPEFTTKVDDYRQAVCKNSKGKFLFLDFVTAKNQRDWLETAQMYGGVYLVGNRWVLSSSPRKNMEKFRERFGGTIEEGTSYGGASGTPK